MVNIDELLNRKPKGWRNITLKEFERDIKVLQDSIKMHKSAIAEDDETKIRLVEKIDQYEEALKLSQEAIMDYLTHKNEEVLIKAYKTIDEMIS